ncbi:MAG: peptide ABC transporter permease [Acidimicrobiaceae bacterium]|nr:MAG: peptide ABC transporter permease [Acidimicrobiaceae bacterium]
MATNDGTIVSGDVTHPPEDFHKHRSLWGDVWRQFRRHKGALAGLFVLIFVTVASFLGPMLMPYDPMLIDVKLRNLGPSFSHPLGTDNLGRDMVARSMVGGRISLLVAITAMALSVLVGVSVGILAGYFRRLDGPLMRITDTFLAIPQLPVLMVLIMLFREKLREVFGPEVGIFLLIMISIGALSWMQAARVVRGKGAVHQAARVRGCSAQHRDTSTQRHLPPHFPRTRSARSWSQPPGMAVAIITESALSFLGLGFPSDFPTWGRLLYDGKDFIQITPMRVVGPGTLISLTVISINYIGDGLRDALDPKARRR